jgi:hypothetical protein
MGGSPTIAARNKCPARPSRRAVFQLRGLLRNFLFALRMKTNISPFASARNSSCPGSRAKDPEREMEMVPEAVFLMHLYPSVRFDAMHPK